LKSKIKKKEAITKGKPLPGLYVLPKKSSGREKVVGGANKRILRYYRKKSKLEILKTYVLRNLDPLKTASATIKKKKNTPHQPLGWRPSNAFGLEERRKG